MSSSASAGEGRASDGFPCKPAGHLDSSASDDVHGPTECCTAGARPALCWTKATGRRAAKQSTGWLLAMESHRVCGFASVQGLGADSLGEQVREWVERTEAGGQLRVSAQSSHPASEQSLGMKKTGRVGDGGGRAAAPPRPSDVTLARLNFLRAFSRARAEAEGSGAGRGWSSFSGILDATALLVLWSEDVEWGQKENEAGKLLTHVPGTVCLRALWHGQTAQRPPTWCPNAHRRQHFSTCMTLTATAEPWPHHLLSLEEADWAA
ncbi:hypothetical protein TREES_T100015624 [Tupaia chinensis]|uniref:Uncharacterized protein n=1 Tax=Tupaia chinensis TaxID=246437 RepID=L9LBQ4_TUPCH|nr:hypothetical protein TREES_T100015624 [Tupaia chinensis]